MTGLELIGPGIKLAPTILEKMSASLKRPIADVRIKITNLFGAHVKFTELKCKYIKTITSNDQPVLLTDVYVNLNLDINGVTIVDSEILRSDDIYRKIIVRGTAGAGKTMMMKYLAYHTLESSGKIPIFIDLREVENPRVESFLKSLFRISTPDQSKHEYEIFYAALRSGLFTFFFDGLDEVNPDYRQKTLAIIPFA